MAYQNNYRRKTPEEKQKEIEELTTKMTQKIENYFESEENIKEHLRFMSIFHKYSIRNMALIDQQFQGATAVGSFNFWKSKGVSIKKGEKGIKILVPVPVKYFNYANDEKGKPFWKQVKYASKEEKEKIEKGDYITKTVTFFKIGHVFEYTQTNAREVGLEVSEIFGRYHRTGTIENDKEFLKAFEKIADSIGVKIIDEPPTELGTAKGAFYPDLNVIALNPRNTMADNIPVMIHELAHAELHNCQRQRERELTTNEKEFQAEMTAYVVANHFGIEIEKFSLPYLASWTKNATINDKEQLLNEVRVTANKFIDIIDNHFEKQKSKELTFEKPIYLISYGTLSDTYITKISTKDQLLETLRNQHTLMGDEIDYIRSKKKNILSVVEKLENISDYNTFISTFNKNMTDYYLYEQTDNRPKLLIEWSEHMDLENNKLMKFGEANIYISQLSSNHFDKIRTVLKQNNDQFPDNLNVTPYYKTRYHVLIPNGNYVTLINPPRFDIGDGYYNSPYQQIISEMNIERDVHNKLLTEIAICTHERNYNDFSLSTISKPSMLLHGYTNGFKDFNKLNGINYNELNTNEIKFTVAIPQGDKLHVYSNHYNKDKYLSPLHQMKSDKNFDKSIYNILETNVNKGMEKIKELKKTKSLVASAFELER